jgi:restriction system protein
MVISSNQYTSACEELAGYNAVRLHSRSDLIEIMNFFKSGQIDKAKDIIESEPRIILDSWDNYMKSNKVIKKDFKAEKRLDAKK